MSDTSKHALCAVLSAVLALIGLAVLIEISTGLFKVALPLEPIYERAAEMARSAASILWSLRYIFIVITAFWAVFAPPNSGPVLWPMVLVTFAVIIGNNARQPRMAGETLSMNDYMTILGLPMATMIVSIITAGLILRTIRCARRAGLIG